MTLTIKLDRNWSSFQLANSAPPLSVTDSALAPSARMHSKRGSEGATFVSISTFCSYGFVPFLIVYLLFLHLPYGLVRHLEILLVEARKLTTSREILLWMTPSEAPKALQASECSELLDPMRASCWISAQH